MTKIVDLAKRRFDAAKDATTITPADALREALRSIEAGEWAPHSVVIAGVTDYPETDTHTVDCYHGGKASTLERIGILFRAQNMLLP